VGHPTPMHPARVGGRHHRALKAGWRKRTFIEKRRNPFPRDETVLFRKPPGIIRCHLLRPQGKGQHGEGLCRRRLLTGNFTLGHGPLLDREKRLTCFTVKQADVSHLCSHSYSRNITSVAL